MMINNVMNELIGRKFKRNKYGLSKWTEEIRDVRLSTVYEKIDGLWVSKPEIMVSKFEPTDEIKYIPWYSLDEIVLISELSEKTVKILDLKQSLNKKITLKDLDSLNEK